MKMRMILRVQSLVWLFTLCFALVQASSSQKLTLYHQLLHDDSSEEITQRGIVHYDPSTNSAHYEKMSEVVDLTTGKGIYRIGFLNSTTQRLSPVAFTRLVSTLPTNSLIPGREISPRSAIRGDNTACIVE